MYKRSRGGGGSQLFRDRRRFKTSLFSQEKSFQSERKKMSRCEKFFLPPFFLPGGTYLRLPDYQVLRVSVIGFFFLARYMRGIHSLCSETWTGHTSKVFFAYLCPWHTFWTLYVRDWQITSSADSGCVQTADIWWSHWKRLKRVLIAAWKHLENLHVFPSTAFSCLL